MSLSPTLICGFSTTPVPFLPQGTDAGPWHVRKRGGDRGAGGDMAGAPGLRDAGRAAVSGGGRQRLGVAGKWLY